MALPNAPTATDWHSVQTIPPGTDIYIRANARKVRCNITSSEANALVCDRGITFKSSDIETVQLPHRLRSTLVGAGIGAAVGIGIGEATYKSGTPGYNRGGAAIGGGVLFGSVGAVIGYFKDFTRSTVYRNH